MFIKSSSCLLIGLGQFQRCAQQQRCCKPQWSSREEEEGRSSKLCCCPRMISGHGSCCYLQPTLAGAGKSVFPIAVNFACEGLPSMILLWQLLQPLHKSVHVLVVFESARVAAETELEEIYLSFLARGSCSQEMSP